MTKNSQPDVNRLFFKAFIRVVKSMAFKDLNEYTGLDTVEVLRAKIVIGL